MGINYARLCARYVLACAMHGGGVEMSDFSPAAYQREDRQRLAHATEMTVLDAGDPNALVPIGIEIALQDGSKLHCTVEDVYGSPENPMTEAGPSGEVPAKLQRWAGGDVGRSGRRDDRHGRET